MNDSDLRVPRRFTVVLVVVTVGVLAWLVARDRPSLDALRGVDAADIALIMLLQFVYLVPESFRQKTVIESSSGVPIRAFRWFRIYIVGRFLNTLIPQGGNAYRALQLKADPGVEVADFGGGMAAFVVMSVVAGLVVSAPLLALESPSITIVGVPAWLVLLLAAAVLGTAPFLISLVLHHRFESWAERSRLVGVAAQVGTATMTALRDRRLMLRFAVLWAVTLSIAVVLYRIVFSVVGWSIGVGIAIAVFALLQASSSVVITPGNLGLQELGMAGLVALFGAPAALGVLAAALIRVTGWIAIALPAVVFGAGDVLSFFRDAPDRAD